MTQNAPAVQPLTVFKKLVNSESVQQRLKSALNDQAGLFCLSLIDIYSSSKDLQNCDPNLVMAEAMKAASLKLPLTKGLGFAYIVPFKEKGTPKPTFIPGYKGLIQLALRTGQYENLNAGMVPEGMTVERDFLSGRVKITGEPTSQKPQGYFAHMELKTGFKKTVYWTHQEVIDFAKAKSPSYKNKFSAWATDPEKMCIKTVLRNLLSTWSPMSIEFIEADSEEYKPEEKDITPEVNQAMKEEKPKQEQAKEKPEPTKPQEPPAEMEPGFGG